MAMTIKGIQIQTIAPSRPTLCPSVIQGNEIYLYDGILNPTQSSSNILTVLISKAETEVKIIDPYFHNGDEVTFSFVKNGVSVKILSSGVTTSVECQTNWAKMAIYKNSNGFSCEYRVIDPKSSLFRHPPFTHDRFLCCDDKWYVVGCSMSGHLLNEYKTTGVYRITDDSDANQIESMFKRAWTHSMSKIVK